MLLLQSFLTMIPLTVKAMKILLLDLTDYLFYHSVRDIRISAAVSGTTIMSSLSHCPYRKVEPAKTENIQTTLLHPSDMKCLIYLL